MLITGTSAFFEGHQGVARLQPLAQRLHVDFQTEARFDNLRSPQIRLPAFDLDRLCKVGIRIRDIYALYATDPGRIISSAMMLMYAILAALVTGKLGGKVGVAPRIFLKKLVADILDRIDQHPDFDPRVNYVPMVDEGELTKVERQAAGVQCG